MFSGTLDGQGHAITGLTITNASDYNAFIGYIDGGTVRDLTVAGLVSGKQNVGGIVGYANDATLENLGNYATVTATGTQTGGIAGYVDGDSSITSCFNKGNVTSTGNQNCGGIAGYAGSDVAVSNCYSSGNISGKQYVGGIVGQGSGVSIKNCYVLGTLTGTNASNFAAINGSMNNENISNCYYVDTLGVVDSRATKQHFALHLHKI